MQMKRVISLVLAVVLLLSVTAVPVAAEGSTPSLSLSVVPVTIGSDGTITENSESEFKAGDYIMLKVALNNDATVRYVQAVQLAVTYDSEALTTVQKSTSAGKIGPGVNLTKTAFTKATTTPEAGVATLSLMTDGWLEVAASGSVELAGFLFQVNDAVETGTYHFGFDTISRVNKIEALLDTEAVKAEPIELDFANTTFDVAITGNPPALGSVVITPTDDNAEAAYGEEKTYTLKALSDKNKDITDCVTWSVALNGDQAISGYTLEGNTLKVTNAQVGTYTVTATPNNNLCTGSAEGTFTVAPQRILNLDLALAGYGKGLNIADATITGNGVTVGAPTWYEGESEEAASGSFKAATAYKVAVTLTPDANHEFAAGATATLAGKTVDIVDNTAVFTLDETANKDTPEIIPPNEITATYGQKLSDVSVTDFKATFGSDAAEVAGEFHWKDGTQFVGNVGSQAHTIVFTPNDTENYAATSAQVSVSVAAADISGAAIENIADQEYTGEKLEPALTITFHGETVSSDDYTAVYTNNTDVGQATVTITGKGNYTGEVTKNFQITKSINHEDIKVELSSEKLVYDGTAKQPSSIVVKDGDTPLTLNTDYTLQCIDCFNAGLATLKIKGIGSYTGEKTVNFTIEPQILSITADKVPNITDVYFYDGTAKTPEVNELTIGEIKLTKDKDYTVEYDNNINAGNKAEIIIKPIEGSNYTFDTCTKNFSIEKAILSGVAKEHNVSVRYGDSTERTFSADDVTGLAGKGTFTMSHIQVPDENTIFTYGEFKGLMTYHLKTTKDNVDQTISVQVTFHSDNYEDVTVTLKVTIVGKLDANLMVNGITDKMSMTYGDTKTLTWSVAEAAKGGKIEVTSSAADVIAVEENRTLRAVKVGTAKITVKYETADYYDEAEFNITVNKKPITVTAENMTVVYGDGWDGLAYDIPDDALVGKDSPLSLNIKPETKATSASPVGEYQITLTQAEGANPNYAVTMNPGTLTITKAPLTIESATVKSKEYDGNKTATVTAVEFSGLKNNETLTSSDYTATGEFKDANAGAEKEVGVTVTLNTTGTAANYELKSNTLDAKGTIEKRTTQVKFTEIKDATYTGKPYARENYTVNSENAIFKFYKADGNSLGEEISAPTDVGKYYITAIVEETANEKLSAVTEGFEITAKSLADDDITVEAIPDQTYTGEQLTPAVTIKYNGMTLTADKDYTVAYENCTNVGVATAKITGKGNYEGTTTKTFNITAKPVTNAQVIVNDTGLVYDKTAKQPTVIVKIGDTEVPPADYDVAYSNNVNAGTATATVTFKGNYTGTGTGTFTIAPKTVGLTWEGSEFLYDKTEKTVTATAADVETGDTVTVTVKGGKQTEIGTYIATAAKLDNPNYKLPETGLSHSFTIKNAIETISVVSPVTVSAAVDGLSIRLVGTKKDTEPVKLAINGEETTPVNGKLSVRGIDYTVDDSGVVRTPNDVKLAEIPAAVPDAPANASADTKLAVAAIQGPDGAKSEGLAAAAAAAVTKEAAKKNTSAENKEVKADVKLEIEVKDYEKNTADNKSVLTLEVTPKVTYTYKDESGKEKTETKTIDNSDIKAPVIISVKLPEGMPMEDLFVKHGKEYIRPTVDKTNRTITWQQSSFSPVVIMSDARAAKIVLVKDNGEKITMDLDLSGIGTALPKDGNKTNWKFDGIDGSYSTITEALFDKLAKKGGTVTAVSVSGSSSDPEPSKPSKPGNSSSGLLLPGLGDDELIFRDVGKYDYYYNAVKWALKKDITSGTGRYTFSPDAACTRAQTVTFLWRAAGSPRPVSTVNPFTDVHYGDYFYQAVLWAVENGITMGTSATTFSPDATVTRAQVVTFLWRANGQPAAWNSGFTDVSADAYYAKAVAWAVQNGITTGISFGVFSPDAACTRAQIVTFLYRYLG